MLQKHALLPVRCQSGVRRCRIFVNSERLQQPPKIKFAVFNSAMQRIAPQVIRSIHVHFSNNKLSEEVDSGIFHYSHQQVRDAFEEECIELFPPALPLTRRPKSPRVFGLPEGHFLPHGRMPRDRRHATEPTFLPVVKLLEKDPSSTQEYIPTLPLSPRDTE